MSTWRLVMVVCLGGGCALDAPASSELASAEPAPSVAPGPAANAASSRFEKFGMSFDVPAGTNVKEVDRGKLQMVTIDQAANETSLQLLLLRKECPDPSGFARKQFDGTKGALPPGYTVVLDGEDTAQRIISGVSHEGARVRFSATSAGTTVARTIEAYAVPGPNGCGVALLQFTDAKFAAEQARIEKVLASFEIEPAAN